jgi:hypothetical protein
MKSKLSHEIKCEILDQAGIGRVFGDEEVIRNLREQLLEMVRTELNYRGGTSEEVAEAGTH